MLSTPQQNDNRIEMKLHSKKQETDDINRNLSLIGKAPYTMKCLLYRSHKRKPFLNLPQTH